MKAKHIKLVQEIEKRKVELIIYAAFICGFLASFNEKRTLDNPDNWAEIKRLTKLLTKE